MLNPQFDLQAFLRRLESAKERILLLDYDGTLAPFRTDPAQATPYSGVAELLGSLSESPRNRLSIVSGRSIRDLLPLWDPGITMDIWGSHGREHLSCDKIYTVAPVSESVQRGLEHARDWARTQGLEGRCEEKPGCLAFHVRGLDSAQALELKHRAEQAWQPMTCNPNLTLRRFDGGIELRATDRTKADAVRAALSGIQSSYAAAYLGDDLTDEDAFEAIRGHGIGVLVRPELRSTGADMWIQPPQELLVFLKHWI